MNGIRRKNYYVGLFGIVWLKIENTYSFTYAMKLEHRILVVNNKVMKIYNKDSTVDNYIQVDESEIDRCVIKSLNEDGSRWEGDWYNRQPFGFGERYDREGNRMYSGFVFEGKKIGFGMEYFANSNKVDYCGNFMNDLRHGWGITYDRNGDIKYEGDWRFGKNDFEDERIVIKDNCEEDDLRIHDLIKELVIGEKCFNEWKNDLIIQNYSNLEKISVKKKSLKNLNSLKICNCEKLKTLEIEDGEWRDGEWNTGVFYNVKNVIIESI